MSTLKDSGLDIDAVITWVDGNDESWQEKLNKHAKIKIDFSSKKDAVRYNSIGEINIAIKSIIKYASFLRNIFLVTDNQKPEFFEELKQIAMDNNINLSLVDHKVIFKGYEDYLPSFNSRSIASVLHRIPNLSEHFIIFNDDTFLMRETVVEDYFNNGLPVLRGEWKKFYEDQIFRKFYYRVIPLFGIHEKNNSTGFKKAMQLSAKMAGATKYLRRFHTPIPIRKSIIENFLKDNEHLENNIKYRFRDGNQFLVEALANHLEIKENTFFYEKDTQLTYFRSYKRSSEVKLKLDKFLNDKKKLFMTFQSLEMADESTLEYILKWINNRIN